MQYKRTSLRSGKAILTIIVAIICLLALNGCGSPKTLFYWGKNNEYDNFLYSYYMKNENEASFESLKSIIAQAEKNNFRVAPGIYAEYGFHFYKQGQPAMAVQYFKQEAEAYPESVPLMQQLIIRIEKNQSTKGEDAGTIENEPTLEKKVKESGGIQ